MTCDNKSGFYSITEALEQNRKQFVFNKMPLHLDDFIKLLADLCKDQNIRVAVKSSLEGAAIAGVCTGLGGLFLGPVGLALGGTLGGLMTAFSSPKYKSVAEILINMSEKQKQELCSKVAYAFRDFGLTDIATIAAMVLSQEKMRNLALQEVTNYLTKDMGLQISV